jgi:hypothetical protein
MLPQAEDEQHMSIRAKLIGGISALALLAGVAAARLGPDIPGISGGPDPGD